MQQPVPVPEIGADLSPIVEIDIVSDTICPWCFVGKRRLEKALAQVPSVRANVHWRPFQLDETIPEGGIDRQTYLERKFGTQGAKQVYDKIRAAGAEEGIDFAFEKIKRTPNTVNSHRLLHWAEEEGKQTAVAERLFQLYFLEGEDIGDLGVLASAASQCGMEARVAEQLKTDKDRAFVLRQIAQADEMGIEGVPCFIFGGNTYLPGAQSADVLAQAIVSMRAAA